MKIFKYVISIILVMVVVVESVGFNLISYCTGAYNVVLAIDTVDLECPHEHQEVIDCCHCSSLMMHSMVGSDHEDLCQNHTAEGIHSHHHDDNCITANFLQLRPSQKSFFYFLLALVFAVIAVFEFFRTVALPCRELIFARVPLKYGRQILCRHSVLLI